ncbi:Protein FAR1-RELATED SEQUENCE 5 [Glycine max]|nr:Protein FAR1-RELATED SEQUENCE 5 [Glycine max]
MKLIDCDQYVYWFRQLGNEDVVGDIMWAHPNSIKLLNSFPTVLICDTTYKTNKYHLPLLEIIGITSTRMIFVVAFAYLSFERMNYFEWALSKLKGSFVKDNVLSQVIISDRDLALMNALEIMFPCSTKLLCLFHITNNVSTKCKVIMDNGEEWQNIMDAWELLL